MARRLHAAARRAQLLEVARGVFAEEGYHGAGMEEIASRAGVTKPVLYQHFEGKKELYLALLDQDMTALLTEIAQAIAEAPSNRERIERGTAAYFDFIEANDGAFRLLFRETMGADPDFRATIERFRDAVTSRIAQIIADEAGLADAEAELLARAMMGMSESAAQWWLDRRGVTKEQAVEILASLAWRGLARLPQRAEIG